MVGSQRDKGVMRNAGIKTVTVTKKAENGPKNAKNKNIGIILLKSMVVAPNGLIKWPNVLDKETMLTLAFRQKSKREKSNLSVQMALPQEKKLKLCENVAGKNKKFGAKFHPPLVLQN